MATTYDIYFGTDPNALVLLAADVATTSYAMPEIVWGETYYWRVDSTNDAGTTTGDVWSFTTQLLYPPDPQTKYRRLVAAANNRIWYANG